MSRFGEFGTGATHQDADSGATRSATAATTFDGQPVKSMGELRDASRFEKAKNTYRGVPGELPKSRLETALTATSDWISDNVTNRPPYKRDLR